MHRDSILSEDRIRNINKQAPLTSPTAANPYDCASGKGRNNFSSIKFGNKLEFNQSLNRVDTSTGSAYSPKSLDESSKVNIKEITEQMRKANFLLSFKREDKLFPSITRNITIISEEEEPPASFCKGSKLANKKEKKP